MNSSEFRNKLKKLNKNNIAIMGHMGSGKSTIGRLLAKQLESKHIDSDAEIIRYADKSINKIFEEGGEGHFRSIEKKIIFGLIEEKNIILSLGGGAILSKSIRNKLRKKSITLFLDVSLQNIEKRLNRSNNRPLLKNANIKNKVKELDSTRRKYYLLADITIKNFLSPFNTCQDIIKKLTNFHEKTHSNNNQR